MHQIPWAIWANRQFEQAQKTPRNRYDYDAAADALERYCRPGLTIRRDSSSRRKLPGSAVTPTQTLFVDYAWRKPKGALTNRVDKELGLLEMQNGKLTQVNAWFNFYMSSGDRRIVFGLGSSGKPGRLTVKWLWVDAQTFDKLEPGAY